MAPCRTKNERCIRKRLKSLLFLLLLSWYNQRELHHTSNIYVLSLIYLNDKAYSFQPAYYGAPLRLGDYNYYVRLQYFTNNPNFCDTANIVVVDSTTTANSTSNDASEFVIPAAPNEFEINSTSTVLEDDIPVALLVLLNEECDTVQQQVLNAQRLHPSIAVLFISSYVPNSTQPLELYLRDESVDVRIFVATIPNATGEILRNYILSAPDNITSLGGPILRFDSIGTFYNTDSYWPQPNTADTDSTASRGVIIFVVIMHVLVFMTCIIGSSRDRITSFGRNETSTNENNPSTTNAETAVGVQQSSLPQQNQHRRLLDKEEVQQFVTVLPPSCIPSTNQNNTNDIENDSKILPVLHTTTSTAPQIDDDDNNDSEYYCSICLTELSCCPIDNVTSTIDNDPTTAAVARLPCLHVFHMKCIVPWLTERQSHCPLCKYDVLSYVTDHLTA